MTDNSQFYDKPILTTDLFDGYHKGRIDVIKEVQQQISDRVQYLVDRSPRDNSAIDENSHMMFLIDKMLMEEKRGYGNSSNII